tara:strand:+ start:127 stop:543 length:417 start_codon:yes stop_codon:yes gene_type:complete
MGFLLELSLDTKKNSNISQLKNILIEEALKNKCEIYFFNYEFMGKNRHIYRHHFILTFIFEENEELIANFIRFIKKNHRHSVKVESLFFENCIYEIMYASTKYLNMMDKDKAKDYIEKRRSNNLYKQDSVIIKAIQKR